MWSTVCQVCFTYIILKFSQYSSGLHIFVSCGQIRNPLKMNNNPDKNRIVATTHLLTCFDPIIRGSKESLCSF